MTKHILTQAELKEQLHYNQDTGIFTWVACRPSISAGKIAGSVAKIGYIYLSINKNKYLAHRLAWFYVHGVWPKHQIDHINGIRTDNRICNLREATNFQNAQNKRKLRPDNRTGYTGVNLMKNGKYRARIMVNQKEISLGRFTFIDDAIQAYKVARSKYHEYSTI